MINLNCIWRAFLVAPAFMVLQSALAQKKPNIDLLLADNIGYGDLGCYGQKMINTPNLDAMAVNGIRFSDYYSGCTVCAPSRETIHKFSIQSTQQLHDLFKYSADHIPFASSHRGGPTKGYPENCIATFVNTLRHTWSIMEIDPHYTKDSAIVLMHDPTLDRTSTGHGKVSDFTLAELNQLNLKDELGDVTEWKIPTLDETIEWSKGKTILIMDQKDVSITTRANIVKKHQAQANVILMAYNYADAKLCYSLDKEIIMEVFIADRKSADEFEATGVPWGNVVAFVTHTEPKDSSIFKYIHDKGALCIRGSSRTIDAQYSKEKISKLQLINGYRHIANSGADIIEADLGIEAGKLLEQLKPAKSSKQKYFVSPK